jgi:hypothetical protein
LNLLSTSQVVVQQRKELAEVFGFETRNKYEIFDEKQQLVGYCAEQQKGIFNFLFRQFLGHWRSFDISFFDLNRNVVLIAKHPFRFLFQEFHVYDANGKAIGWADQRFGIFTKKYDVYNSQNQLIFEMRSGFFKFWTFPLKGPNGGERALIQKKWSGFLKEVFMDADNFVVTYQDSRLTNEERLLVLAISVYTDLQYFEKKAGSGLDFG